MRPLLMLAFLAISISSYAQSDRIRVYFSRDVDLSVSSGVDAIVLGDNMDDTIEAYIDRAQYTIDVAVYNANDFSIIYALNDAQERGVQVRYIAEGSNANTAIDQMNVQIPVLYRTDGIGSGMHNKFLSIDADQADIAWVWMGSTNWTQNGLFDDYNNVVFIQHQGLALAYRTEFEEMWGGSGAQPDQVNSRFGEDKTDNTPHVFDVDGVQVESYFSPSDNTTAHMVDAIDEADHTVRAALFAFTNDDLGTALVQAEDRVDVSVAMDLEDPINPGDEGWYVWTNGSEVYTHNSDNVQLHHKYAIIDEGSADDPLVITGSHNWSWNAENVNDENTLIIHDATVANMFYQEWHARHDAVAGVAAAEANDELRVWTSLDELHVMLPAEWLGAELKLFDALGRVVISDAAVDVRHSLNTSMLGEGAYVLACTKGQRTMQRAVVITR